MGKKEEKTNVMRLLDQAKIEYKHYCYAGTDAVGGMEVVEVLHQDPDQAFKTQSANPASIMCLRFRSIRSLI